jgi:hypothetical protein
MIEPQNTMMPLPAESAPADAPHGEAGFGEMLAQTIGMIPQLNPDAIQPLDHNSGDQQGEDAGDLFADGRSADPDRGGHAPVTRYIAAPVDASARLAEPIAGTRPPFVDAGFVDPVFDGDVALRPPVIGDATPGPVDVGTDPVAADDGIWKPVLTSAPEQVIPVVDADTELVARPSAPPAETPSLPGELVSAPNAETMGSDPALVSVDPVAIDPPGRREPGPVGPAKPDIPITSEPVTSAPAPRPSDPVSSEPVRSIGPIDPKSKPVVRGGDRGLPTQPAPTQKLPDAAGTTAATTTMPDSSTTVIGRPQTDPTPTSPIHLDQAEIKIESHKPVSIGDAPVSLDSSKATAPSVAPTSSFDGAPVQATPVTDLGSPTAPAAPTAHSALAERVLNAVELQANQPPPRTMVVDIPEIEGLRLVVSVRGGAEVHVVQSSASSAVNGLQPFMEELQGVLESRGFVMTGDNRRRSNNPHQDEDQQRPRPSRPTFRRPTDNDLRI